MSRPPNLVFTLTILAQVVVCASAQAKIVDCPPIKEEHVLYSSHADYVEASDANTSKVIWHTVLLEPNWSDAPNPRLEEDVQWNITCLKKIEGDELVAGDSKGRVFWVNKKDGKLDTSQYTHGKEPNSRIPH